jgi:hypothetical protein
MTQEAGPEQAADAQQVGPGGFEPEVGAADAAMDAVRTGADTDPESAGGLVAGTPLTVPPEANPDAEGDASVER